jgi:hypothetical protein
MTMNPKSPQSEQRHIERRPARLGADHNETGRPGTELIGPLARPDEGRVDDGPASRSLVEDEGTTTMNGERRQCEGAPAPDDPSRSHPADTDDECFSVRMDYEGWTPLPVATQFPAREAFKSAAEWHRAGLKSIPEGVAFKAVPGWPYDVSACGLYVRSYHAPAGVTQGPGPYRRLVLGRDAEGVDLMVTLSRNGDQLTIKTRRLAELVHRERPGLAEYYLQPDSTAAGRRAATKALSEARQAVGDVRRAAEELHRALDRSLNVDPDLVKSVPWPADVIDTLRRKLRRVSEARWQ